jgi:hypothetical protein
MVKRLGDQRVVVLCQRAHRRCLDAVNSPHADQSPGTSGQVADPRLPRAIPLPEQSSRPRSAPPSGILSGDKNVDPPPRPFMPARERLPQNPQPGAGLAGGGRWIRTSGSAREWEKLEDLQPGMVLEGFVTNVAAFGAFVDVGVQDPCTIAKPGDVVRVKVLEVDPKRRRSR